MTAEKNTPMIVSEERALFRCTAMMPSPTRMPKTGMATCGLMEKIRPSATPAKAEWLMASEKKAMRKLTTCTPMVAAIGASRIRATSACCMNPACRHSKGIRDTRR